MDTDTVDDPDRPCDAIERGRALVRAIEALEDVQPSSGLERLLARSLADAYRRRLRRIIAAAPAWAGDRILGAMDDLPDPQAPVRGDR